jgi:hypothetical protein
LNDRAADAWEPLLAIADAAGDDWPARARAAALALHDVELDSDSTNVALLRAIRDVFEHRGVDRMRTADLIAELVARDSEPWGTWWGAAVDEAIPAGRATSLRSASVPSASAQRHCV